MPISYRVDHEARVVVAAGHGVLTDADVCGYQREAWSRPDVAVQGLPADQHARVD